MSAMPAVLPELRPRDSMTEVSVVPRISQSSASHATIGVSASNAERNIEYRRHPHTGEWVEISPDQRWFWTPEWQAGEREVDVQLEAGEYENFDSMEDFLAAL